MMKAYQVTEFKKPLACLETAKPTPTGFDVLVKTTLTGVCHTDLHVAHGDLGEVPLPITPGHEGVGIVEAVGPDVKTVKVGDRVGCAWLGTSCMKCDLCKDGRENLCVDQEQTGFKRNGSFAEYFLADERFLGKIPDSVSDASAAPVLCAGVTSYKAVKQAGLKAGQRIVISGACGGLGHMAVQYAKAMGLEVVALDMFNDEKKKLLKDLGADFIVGIAPRQQLVETMQALEPKKPIAGAVIFAPRVEAVADAVAYCSAGATIVAIALPNGVFPVNPIELILKELTLKGSIVGTPRDLAEAFRYVAEGKVHAHTIEDKIEKVNEILDQLHQGKVLGRVCLRMNA